MRKRQGPLSGWMRSWATGPSIQTVTERSSPVGRFQSPYCCSGARYWSSGRQARRKWAGAPSSL
ncbi:hypothetical protein [Paludisphaera rhizosphaerae]|uniref:hypothetical protein n=1 Tax=Paludisphaera rhizosphaerae TaxID=2711216 RepID=UPI00197CEA8D|nr:hypothetical protein [Paludisphaera rhizosphaerae]